MKQAILRHRRVLAVLVQLVLVALANYGAFWLRFEGDVPPHYWDQFIATLPWLLGVRALSFVPFRLYEGLWRYSGMWDLLHIVAAVAVGTLAFVALSRLGLGQTDYPRSVYIMDFVLLVCLLGGVRLGRRAYREFGAPARSRRVLIFGAGDAGEMIVRDMKNNPFYDCEPVAFVDDDRAKLGTRIHGVPVLGGRKDLQGIITRVQPHEVLVAMPRTSAATIRQVVRDLEPFRLPISTLPNLRDILDGRVTVDQIRKLSIEDLLTRDPVGLDEGPLRSLLGGKCVLVTGAGGSLGSELCRQIARYGPIQLVFVERYENSLYVIEQEFVSCHPDSPRAIVVADVTDEVRMEELFARYRPDIVFHAAAHKHVPLMEANRCEAVKNNVRGTRIVAEAAARHGATRFVLISTDKAVNPSSVMGATKRVAELVVQAMSATASTCFVAVRFGNVLNSNGSVVPLFMSQIRAGGPVTVTHPEIKRYFMLIPEAVQLVLHAAALGQSGAVYALEMGDQIRVVDMARNLIRLSGFLPEEIPIKFTGLRPGEKLHEELVSAEEVAEPSPIDKIMRVRAATPPDAARLARHVMELERAALQDDQTSTMHWLQKLVPITSPSGSAAGSVPTVAASGR